MRFNDQVEEMNVYKGVDNDCNMLYNDINEVCNELVTNLYFNLLIRKEAQIFMKR